MPQPAPEPAPSLPLSDAPPPDAARRPGVGLHRWALLTLLAMFPLIWFGGLTTSHQAGLSVPDWPNTYGYNMFAVRWDLWLGESAGGIFFEHTHRLLGSLVGLLSVAAVLWAWGPSRSVRARRWWGAAALVLAVFALASFVLMRLDVGGRHRSFGHAVSLCGGLGAIALLGWLARTREPRRWVRWMTAALLLAVIVQGVLGGLRVTEVNLELAVLHGIFAQITLCLAGFLALATSAWWLRGRDRLSDVLTPAGRRLTSACAVLTLLVLGQLVIAAMMRHYQAGLAVPDFPLSYGQFLPPVSAEGLARANDARVFDYSLEPTTLGGIWLHTAHRMGALLVTITALWVIRELLREARGPAPTWLASLVGGLVMLQVCLGVATVWMAKPADVATAHVAGGALLLLCAWLLTVRAIRLYGWWPIGLPESRRRMAPSRAAPVRAAELAVRVSA